MDPSCRETMSERTGYVPGVPCWVDTWRSDAQAAVRFYRGLFGWEAKAPVDATPSGAYFTCTLRGLDVAGVGRGAAPGGTPAWITYVWLESADQSVGRVADAGGGLVREPNEGPDESRVAIVADPEGALLGLWQPGRHRGARVVNEPGAWAWSQLNARDPQRAATFYGAVFGWDTDEFDMGDGRVVTMWRVPGYVGGQPSQPISRDIMASMAALPGRGPETAPHGSIDLWVDDVDQTADRATELGGSVIDPPLTTPVGRSATLRDPHGATFSVSKVPQPGDGP